MKAVRSNRGKPPGLTGKSIGMYYAQKSKQRKKKMELETMPEIYLDQQKEKDIRKVLKSIRPIDSSSKSVNNAEDANDYGPLPLKSIKQSVNRQYNHIQDSDFKMDYIENIAANLLSNSDPDAVNRMGFKKLERDSDLDKQYKNEFLAKQHSNKFRKMFEFRRELPSFNSRAEILRTLGLSQVVVICGETGCGKTTQVPQFILDKYLSESRGSICSIVCTQPRRISAISVAERVAEERDEELGGSVGYQIRVDSQLPRETGSVRFCTTAILLRQLCSNPLLSSVSHLIIDEVHERDSQVDILMAYIKSLLLKRCDLKVILMSATMKAESFSEYFDNCPIIHVPGHAFPVEEFYMEDVLAMTGFKFKSDECSEQFRKHSQRGRDMRKRMAEYNNDFGEYLFNLKLSNKYPDHVLQSLSNTLVEEINLDLIHVLIKQISMNTDEGAILVFLPGWEFISNLNKLLSSDRYFTCGNHLILPLHSIMPTVNQKEVFEVPSKGIRKIIIATNIAETSITINDVVYVIDSGKINLKTYEIDNNLVSLEPRWVSLANAKQRKGRAGRVQPGKCYHLYHRGRKMLLEPYLAPEILRTPLEEVCLQLKLLKLGKVNPFLQKMMDPPERKAIESALKTLLDLNAITDEEELTPLGFHLARLPLDPQTGKLVLLGAIFSCLDPIATIAAVLSFKDPFFVPIGKIEEVDRRRKILSKHTKSDHLMHYFAYKGWENAQNHHYEQNYLHQNFLSGSILNMLKKMKGQLAQHLYDVKLLNSLDTNDPLCNINSNNLELIKAIICAGLYPQVVHALKLTPGKSIPKLTTPENGPVKLHPKSVNYTELEFPTSWLVYKQKVKSSRIFIHDSTMVSPSSLLLFGKTIYHHKDTENNIGMICVDSHIKFKATERTTNLIQKLRMELDKLLAYKISHPGMTCWDRSTQEGSVLCEIVKLLSDDVPTI